MLTLPLIVIMGDISLYPSAQSIEASVEAQYGTAEQCLIFDADGQIVLWDTAKWLEPRNIRLYPTGVTDKTALAERLRYHLQFQYRQDVDDATTLEALIEIAIRVTQYREV